MKQLFVLIQIITLLIPIENIHSMSRDPELKHHITYSRKGSRSESRHGHLFLNGNEIGDYFTLVIYNGNAYQFFQRKHLWGRDGYYPVGQSNYNDKIKKSDDNAGKDLIKKGWYTGNVLLKDTPDSWLYVEWKDGSAFVSPDKIQDMIKELNLEKLPRMIILKRMIKRK